jgi:hypothetical protein
VEQHGRYQLFGNSAVTKISFLLSEMSDLGGLYALYQMSQAYGLSVVPVFSFFWGFGGFWIFALLSGLVRNPKPPFTIGATNLFNGPLRKGLFNLFNKILHKKQ